MPQLPNVMPSRLLAWQFGLAIHERPESLGGFLFDEP